MNTADNVYMYMRTGSAAGDERTVPSSQHGGVPAVE